MAQVIQILETDKAASCADYQKSFSLDVLVGLSERRKSIPSIYHYDAEGSRLFKAITELTDGFCLDHLQPLHLEYLVLCQGLTAACCQKDSPVVEGKAKAQTWAAAMAYTIGWANFLSDPDLEPTLTSKQVAAAFGVSVGTMQSRSLEIRQGLSRIAGDFQMLQLSRRFVAWMEREM